MTAETVDFAAIETKFVEALSVPHNFTLPSNAWARRTLRGVVRGEAQWLPQRFCSSRVQRRLWMRKLGIPAGALAFETNYEIHNVAEEDPYPERDDYWAWETESCGFRIALTLRLHASKWRDEKSPRAGYAFRIIEAEDVEIARYDNRNRIDDARIISDPAVAEEAIKEAALWFREAARVYMPTTTKDKPRFFAAATRAP